MESYKQNNPQSATDGKYEKSQLFIPMPYVLCDCRNKQQEINQHTSKNQCNQNSQKKTQKIITYSKFGCDFSNQLLRFFIIIILLISSVSCISTQCQFVGSSVSKATNPNAHTDVISGIKVSSDGKFLVTSSGDKTIKIWNITQGILNYALYFQINDTISQYNSSISYSGLFVSKTGASLIVEAGSTGHITIYNVSNFSNPSCITLNLGYPANFVAINSQNNRVIVGGNNPKSSSFNMMIYDYNGTYWNQNYAAYDQFLLYLHSFGGVLSVDDSKLIILNNLCLNIMIYNPLTLGYQSVQFQARKAIRCVMSVDTLRIVYFSKDQYGFTIADYQFNRYLVSQTVTNTSGMVRDIYLSPDKIRLIVGQSDFTVNLYIYYNNKYSLAQTLALSTNNQVYTLTGN